MLEEKNFTMLEGNMLEAVVCKHEPPLLPFVSP